jgi:hypothetical protein
LTERRCVRSRSRELGGRTPTVAAAIVVGCEERGSHRTRGVLLQPSRDDEMETAPNLEAHRFVCDLVRRRLGEDVLALARDGGGFPSTNEPALAQAPEHVCDAHPVELAESRASRVTFERALDRAFPECPPHHRGPTEDSSLEWLETVQPGLHDSLHRSRKRQGAELCVAYEPRFAHMPFDDAGVHEQVERLDECERAAFGPIGERSHELR